LAYRETLSCGTGATVWVAGKRSGRGEPAGGWQQGMRAGRRPQDVVGLDAVDLLAEQAMRSGRRMGLVIGCLADGEHGRLRTRTRRRPCRAARTHSPHSRPFSPSSGGPAAIRRPPARPRRPPGRPGPAAASQTHYRVDHLGPPSCRRQTSASYARSQVLSGLLPHRRWRPADGGKVRTRAPDGRSYAAGMTASATTSSIACGWRSWRRRS
jgi:hypothetical protein